MSKEIWRNIEGYDNRYMVSSMGRVMAKPYRYMRKNPAGFISEYVRKPVVLKQNELNGYKRVCLSNSGAKNVLVHRLVAEAFIPNPDMLPEVNHKNWNRSDNRVENLEWCTVQQNRQRRLALKSRSDNRSAEATAALRWKPDNSP